MTGRQASRQAGRPPRPGARGLSCPRPTAHGHGHGQATATATRHGHGHPARPRPPGTATATRHGHGHPARPRPPGTATATQQCHGHSHERTLCRMSFHRHGQAFLFFVSPAPFCAAALSISGGGALGTRAAQAVFFARGIRGARLHRFADLTGVLLLALEVRVPREADDFVKEAVNKGHPHTCIMKLLGGGATNHGTVQESKYAGEHSAIVRPAWGLPSLKGMEACTEGRGSILGCWKRLPRSKACLGKMGLSEREGMTSPRRRRAGGPQRVKEGAKSAGPAAHQPKSPKTPRGTALRKPKPGGAHSVKNQMRSICFSFFSRAFSPSPWFVPPKTLLKGSRRARRHTSHLHPGGRRLCEVQLASGQPASACMIDNTVAFFRAHGSPSSRKAGAGHKASWRLFFWTPTLVP